MGIKTKLSKRKLRRWGFEVAIFPYNEDGTVNKQGKGFHSQGVSFGSYKQAKADADDLKLALEKAQQTAGKYIVVTPVPYETVSQATMDQLYGQKDLIDIHALALEIMAEDMIAGGTPASLNPAELKQEYYKRAAEKLKQARQDFARGEGPASGNEEPTVILTDGDL